MYSLDDLLELIHDLDDDQVAEVVAELPPQAVTLLARELGNLTASDEVPDHLLDQAYRLQEEFSERPHLEFLADKITEAVAQVEAGRSQYLILEMPPRSGKTTLASQIMPAWILARHPEWPIALTSHDGGLATSWGRQIRRWAESGALGDHVEVSRDAGAASSWETTEGGKLLSISIRESFTGRGAKVLVIDDPHKDFVDAHSQTLRDSVWNWWTSVAQTRLEPPALVLVVMTRWHEDDLVGRLLSNEYPGDPAQWQVISLPAIAGEDDLMGRASGEPLYSPLLIENEEQAIARFAEVRKSVGEYVWSAMYQQSPAPAKGSIFDSKNWRYWTVDPSQVKDDGSVVYLDPATLTGAWWLDSWDMAFKAEKSSDYVVGQRWAMHDNRRYLIYQERARLTFTESVAALKRWRERDNGLPGTEFTHLTLVEDKANGSAVIDTLKDTIPGIKPTNPTDSKAGRAHAVTPEIESGFVYLPHPGDEGNEWVLDLISELRQFPLGAHDDQVDTMTQALKHFRGVPQTASISRPNAAQQRLTAGLIDAAKRQTLRGSVPRIKRSLG